MEQVPVVMMLSLFVFHNEGILDSSGMRLKLTSHLRQHDASVLSFTHRIDSRQVVPPGQKAFITRGFCAPQCTINVSHCKFYGPCKF